MPKYSKERLTLLLLFPAMLLIGFWMLLGLCTKADSVSKVSLSAPLQEQTDRLLQQQTMGSRTLRSFSAGVQYHMGLSQINQVYLTPSRMLEAPDVLDADALEQTAEQINAFYQENQTPICLLAAPCATEFYQDQLPTGVPFHSQKAQLERFYDALQTPIRTIDPYPVLMPVQEDYIFYRTDTKWTSYGAYCVYRSAVQKMGFLPISYDTYVVSHVYGAYRGDLYQQCAYLGITPDILDLYSSSKQELPVTVQEGVGEDGAVRTLYDTEALESDTPYDFYLGADTPLLTITTAVDNEKRLLLLKDDWADCMIPFLTKHFQTIYVLDVTCASAKDAAQLQEVAFDQILMVCDLETYENTAAMQRLLRASSKTSTVSFLK